MISNYAEMWWKTKSSLFLLYFFTVGNTRLNVEFNLQTKHYPCVLFIFLCIYTRITNWIVFSFTVGKITDSITNRTEDIVHMQSYDEACNIEEIQHGQWKRIMLLVVAITVHNIPEGLAVGVGFGAIGTSASATFESARLVFVFYLTLPTDGHKNPCLITW